MPTLPRAPAHPLNLAPAPQAPTRPDTGHIDAPTVQGPVDTSGTSAGQGAWTWLKTRLGAGVSHRPEQGLTAKQAASALRKSGHVPELAQGSAKEHVKALLGAFPANERAGVVQALSALLPHKVNAQIYDATVAWLLHLPFPERSAVAGALGDLPASLRLQTPADATAYVRFLDTVKDLSPTRRPEVLQACRTMQPHWRAAVPADTWRQAVTLLAGVPEAELTPLALQVRRIFAGPTPSAESTSDFLSCVAAYAGLNAAERTALTEQLQSTRITDYRSSAEGSPRMAHLALLMRQSPEDRAAVASACREIFAGRHPPPPEALAIAAVTLLRCPPAERSRTKELLRDLSVAGIAIVPWVADEIHLPMAEPLHDAQERHDVLALVERTFDGAPRSASASWLVVRTLLQLPSTQREDAARLMRSFADRDMLTRPLVDAEILRTGADQRRSHLARLATRNAPAARVGGAGDLESVMQGSLQQQVDSAIAALRRRFPKPMPTARALKEIEVYLEGLQAGGAAHPDAILTRARGGNTEINNAIRTLRAPSERGDFSKSVRETPEMARLCALVWHATSASRSAVDAVQAAKDQALIRHGLVMALARCIEDDGHRVCGVGQRQYIVDVLKGYYHEAGDARQSVTPRALVTVLTAEFYASHKDREAPDAQEVAAFRTRARAVATERFGTSGKMTPELTEFMEQFESYMAMTY